MSEMLALSLWATNMAAPPATRGAWLAQVEGVMDETSARGGQLLLMPEYISRTWLPYCGPDLPLSHEVAAMAAEGAELLPALQSLVDAKGLSMLAGTWPVKTLAGYSNRAYFLRPGAESITHDKLCLTPLERNDQGWQLSEGRTVRIFRWNGLTCAMLICLDVELPAVSLLLAREAPDLDLLLVPSTTRRLSGASRVFGCAKARAIELMTCVAVTGSIGLTPLKVPRPSVSGAAVYLPCEPELGERGVYADTGIYDHTEGIGPLLHVSDLPVGWVRSLRHDRGAEVWPGCWMPQNLRLVRDADCH